MRPDPARTLVVEVPRWPASATGPAALEVVADLGRFSPSLVVLGPGLVAMGTRGPARRFGGEPALAAGVLAAVEAVADGRGASVGVADGIFAAGLAARRARRRVGRSVVVPVGETADFLAPLPVSVLGDPDLAGVLVRLGVSTLGELAALPAPSVGARFGPAGALAHRRARGLDTTGPGPAADRRPVSTSVVLDPPAEQVEAASFAARGVAEQLAGELSSRGLSPTLVCIEMETEHGESLQRRWRTEPLAGSGTAAWGMGDLVGGLVQRVRWQLEGWMVSPDPPRGPLGLLRITAEELAPAAGRQMGFWGDDPGQADRAASAVARVQARMGAGSVRSARVVAGTSMGGRGPGDQVLLETWGDPTSPVPDSGGCPWPGRLPAPSPTLVPPRGWPAEVTDSTGAVVGVDGQARPTAAPARLSVAGGLPVAVLAWGGPWPVDERWWRPGGRRRRARWQVVVEDGSALLLVVEGGRWRVEAAYD